jgi:flagellar biosynthesis component FlhA
VTEYILSHLAKAVGDNPAELLGIQDLLNLLNKSTQESVAEIKASPQEMLRYALVLRRLLEKHKALKDIQSISTQYLNVRKDAEDVEDVANQLASKITM